MVLVGPSHSVSGEFIFSSGTLSWVGSLRKCQGWLCYFDKQYDGWTRATRRHNGLNAQIQGQFLGTVNGQPKGGLYLRFCHFPGS